MAVTSIEKLLSPLGLHGQLVVNTDLIERISAVSILSYKDFFVLSLHVLPVCVLVFSGFSSLLNDHWRW